MRYRGRVHGGSPPGQWACVRETVGPEVAGVGFVSSFPPRRCGIASFTADLAEAVQMAGPGVRTAVVAADPGWESLRRVAPYAGNVAAVHPIVAEDRAAYRQAGRWLYEQGCQVISLQHEYGLFGGRDGEYVVDLVENAPLPVVATLHTVLRHPTPHQRAVLTRLVQLARAVVVQARSAVELLERVYAADPGRILVIPHGTPSFENQDPVRARRRFELEGERPILLTYGLLSPGKGIEQALQALPLIARRYPDVLYVVAGQTHPNVRQLYGEAYRERLQAMAGALGIRDNVRFIDRYLELEELGDLLAATDVYITPYPQEEQVVSGTLSYALAAGCVVVSTPFRYAREVLGPGRGLLCQFDNPASMAEQVLELLDNADLRRVLAHRARAFGQTTSWNLVGARYLRLFAWATVESSAPHRAVVSAPQAVEMPPPLVAVRRRAAATARRTAPGR